MRLLNLAVAPRAGYDPDADPVAPHGLWGQAYDRDDLAVEGATDTPRGAETYTSAQAEGAIEGDYRDYRVATPFATDFRYSRFDLKAALPRDVTKLRGRKHPKLVGPDSSKPAPTAATDVM